MSKSIGIPLVVFLSIFTGLSLCEGAARFFIIYKNKDPSAFYTQFLEIHSFQSHDTYDFELLPNQKDVINPHLGTVFSTNQDGFRGQKEYGDKEVEEIRIALLGGSCTFGYGAAGDDTSLAALLENEIHKEHPIGQKVHVINAGNPGFTSYQVLKRFEHKTAQKNSDIAIIYSGWNDIFLHGKHQEFDPTRTYYRYLKSFDWQNYVEYCNRKYSFEPVKYFALSYIFRRFADRVGWDLFTESSNDRWAPMTADKENKILNHYRENMTQLIRVCLASGTRPILSELFSEYLIDSQVDPVMSAYGPLFKKINNVLAELANEFQIPLIGVQQDVEAKSLSGINNPGDKYHISDKGNRYFAGLISQKIKEIGWLK